MSDLRQKDVREADDVPLPELWAEDFTTHGRTFFEPGFWAVAVHRLGRRAARSRPALVGYPLQLSYRLLATAVDWTWGIKVTASTRLGRRVRIWHNGAVLLDARSIGNDVHIRHDTTFGPLRWDEQKPELLPIIEDGADISSGACVLGGVTVGKDAMVGANTVVLDSVPPGMRAIGVPAKLLPDWIARKT